MSASLELSTARAHSPLRAPSTRNEPHERYGQCYDLDEAIEGAEDADKGTPPNAMNDYHTIYGIHEQLISTQRSFSA